MKIYKITCLINNKVYIGQTIKTLKYRFQNHIRDAVVYKTKTKIGRAIRKYGSENFVIELLEKVTDRALLDKVEEHWIAYFDSAHTGYNIKPGGRGTKHTLSTKRKIAKANSKRIWTEEMRARMSEAIKSSALCKGKKHSEETKKKIGESNRGRKVSKEPYEALQSINDKTRVRVRCNENNTSYTSIKAACRALNVNQREISLHLRGIRKRVKGFTFTRLNITDAH
jgi:group I intron endonuclease